MIKDLKKEKTCAGAQFFCNESDRNSLFSSSYDSISFSINMLNAEDTRVHTYNDSAVYRLQHLWCRKKVLLMVQYSFFFRSPDISDGAAAAFPEGGALVHPERPLDSTLPQESGGIKVLESTFEIDEIAEKGFQLLFPTVARTCLMEFRRKCDGKFKEMFRTIRLGIPLRDGGL